MKNVAVVDSFNIKETQKTIKDALDSQELSVVIVRGACAVQKPKHGETRAIDTAKCNQCGICLLVGCPAIQTKGKQPIIDIGNVHRLYHLSADLPQTGNRTGIPD